MTTPPRPDLDVDERHERGTATNAAPDDAGRQDDSAAASADSPRTEPPTAAAVRVGHSISADAAVAIQVRDLHVNYEVFEDRRAALRDRVLARRVRAAA